MNKFVVASVALLTVGLMAMPAFADHVYVGIGVGGPAPGYYRHSYYGGYYGYPTYPGYYEYPGYAPYYYAPPPVVYAAPPAYPAPQQTVVYTAPPAQGVDAASPTYTDQQGRTCREYQANATVAGAKQQTYGTACLQPDGTWHVIN